jgi:hypothetical protein
MAVEELLWLVARYPHHTALARRARDSSVFAGLRHLEVEGLVYRRRGAYRLTAAGCDELFAVGALARLLAP